MCNGCKDQLRDVLHLGGRNLTSSEERLIVWSRATAFALAAEGAHLALCARNADMLEDAAKQIRAGYGVQVLTEPFDVSDDARVRHFVDAVHRHFGRIDICVTNAGGPPSKTFAETTMEEWDRAYAGFRTLLS